MRKYEKFKSDAQRLVSITCDVCGVEMYKAPGQRSWGEVKILSENGKLIYYKELCQAHLDQAVGLLEFRTHPREAA